MTENTPTRSLAEPSQCASRVLMVRPGSFGRNEAAAGSNAFMQATSDDADRIASEARREFDALASALADAGVEVVIEDEPDLPDSVFPNNWISYHEPAGGVPTLVTYPMATPLRRLERREATVDRVIALAGGSVNRVRLEHLEAEGESIEGTGALVLDRVAGVAFACLSPRATPRALDAWQEASGYELLRFEAADQGGNPIYHTNVLMSIGRRFAVFAPGTVRDPEQRQLVSGRLGSLGKLSLDISPPQMGDMCANILELQTPAGSPVIAMSARAWGGFDATQREVLEGFGSIVRVPIPTIERVGGGSVRCMIAELGASSL